MNELDADQGVNPGCDVVEHDTPAFGQVFNFANWRRFPDIEGAEENQADERVLPTPGSGNERDPLADYFVRDHKLRVFAAALAGDDRRGWNRYGQQKERRTGGDPGEFHCGQKIGRTGYGEMAHPQPDRGSDDR